MVGTECAKELCTSEDCPLSHSTICDNSHPPHLNYLEQRQRRIHRQEHRVSRDVITNNFLLYVE